MTTIDDLSQSIDEINSTLDEMSSNVQDMSDNNDSVNTDIQTELDDHESRLTDVETSSGQLLFPLTQETIDLITEQTPSMLTFMFNNKYIQTAVLVAGTKTIANSYILATSLVLLSRSTTGGTPGHLSYTATAGSLVINSSSGTDTSTIIYFILN